MSDEDLPETIEEEGLKKFYKTPMGHRASVMSMAFAEDVKNWEIKKKEIEQATFHCLDLLEWTVKEKPDILNSIALKKQEISRINSSLLRFFRRPSKLLRDLEELKSYAERLKEREQDLKRQIKILDSKYAAHLSSQPDSKMYEIGIYGKNLFKPRY